MKEIGKHRILLFAMFFLCFSCKEEIELETQDFESVLVVEGTITNEFKFQEIKVSRTYLLEAHEQVLEDNANVTIVDNMDNTYSFTQNTEGTYISDIEFEASPNTNYTLLITTSNGKQYKSLETELTPISQIDNLYTENSENEVQIFIDSANDDNEAQYFRYEYEETHKIVVPYYSSLDAVITNVLLNGKEFDIILVPKTEDQRICYTTNSSIDIIQTSTNQLNNNIVSRFPIRIINNDDSILRERYTILVKQYVQSLEAYNFYKIINELSTSESLLSENQSGYVIGNVSSVNDETEKIAGYFEVASVSSKRIYFNYFDVGVPRPKYPYDCEYRTDEEGIYNLNINHLILDYSLNGGESGEPDQRAILYDLLSPGDYYKYLGGGFGIYKIVSPECGNCTSFSSNIQPDFWED